MIAGRRLVRIPCGYRSGRPRMAGTAPAARRRGRHDPLLVLDDLDPARMPDAGDLGGPGHAAGRAVAADPAPGLECSGHPAGDHHALALTLAKEVQYANSGP